MGTQRVNRGWTRPRKYARPAFDSAPSCTRDPTTYFPKNPLFHLLSLRLFATFREQSSTFAANFFKVMGKTRRNRNPRNHRYNLVEPDRLYRVRSIWKSKQATGNCITSWEVITSESCSISIKKKGKIFPPFFICLTLPYRFTLTRYD